MATVVSITNPITGAVEQVDKLDSTAQQIDDAVALAPQLSNQNLLDNWYFGNPVNQRGQTEYTAGGYTIDRWKLEANGTVKSASVVSSGIALSNGDDTTYLNFAQIVEKIPAGTYVVSFLVDDFSNVNQVFCSATNTSSFTFDSNVVSLKFTLDADSDAVKIGIQKKLSGNVLTIKAAKLELGSQQTLAHQDADGNWVLNEISDYGEQLRRCQRYQLVINRETIVAGRTSASADTTCFAFIPTPVTMRVAPAISKTVGNYIATVNHVNGNKSITDFTGVSLAGNGIYVTGEITTGLGTTQPITVTIPGFIADANL